MMGFKQVIVATVIVALTTSAERVNRSSVTQLLQLDYYCDECYQLLSLLINALYDPTLSNTRTIIIINGQKTNIIATLINKIVSEISLPVLNINVENSIHLVDKKLTISDNDMIITLIESKKDFLHKINTHEFVYWNKRANFMFVFPFCLSKDDLSECFSEFLNIRIFKVTVLCINMHGYNSDPAQNSQKVTLLLASCNPFLNTMHMQQGTLETLNDSKTTLVNAYSTQSLENLNGHTLRVSAAYSFFPPGYSFWESSQGVYEHDGYLATIYDTLSQYMNYTVKHYFVHDWWQFGHKHRNGTWLHILGDLVRKEVDLAYAPLSIQTERYQVMDFSENFVLTQASIIVPRGKEIPAWKSLLLLYEPEAWACILVVFVIQSGIFRVLQVLRFSQGEMDFCEVILFPFSILMQVSVKQPDRHTNRIFFFIWTYFSLLISSIYVGGIVSVLTTPKYYKSINTLKELASSQMPIKGAIFYLDLLNDKSNQDLWSLYKNFQLDAKYDKSVESIILGEMLTVVGPEVVLSYYGHKHHICRDCPPAFHIMKEHLGIQIAAIGVSQGSSLVQRFNILIGRMQQSGLISKWVSNTLRATKFQRKCNRICHGHKKISLQQIQGAFYLIIIGLPCVLFIFILEFIHGKYMSTSN